jgi:mitotic spindle assembly checkpoint protein MAD2
MSTSSKPHPKPPSKKPLSTHKLALKGSSKLISDFFEYSINTILYQRGIYPPEDFSSVKKYGLSMLVSSDDQVKAYIKSIMKQLNKWMLLQKISNLVVVVTGKESGDVLERWQFDIALTKPPSSKPSSSTADENAPTTASTPSPQAAEPTDEQIQSQIRALFRQITASVTFLPELSEPATFNVLVYASADSDVPIDWGDSDAREIDGGEKVQLRSFSTANHRVDAIVSYRMED